MIEISANGAKASVSRQRIFPRTHQTHTASTNGSIATEDLPRIFDRFYKGGASRGSGLGLTIARNLVVAHGGDIKAESQPGQGTTITVSLPTGE